MRVLHIQKAAGVAGSERHLLALLPRLQQEGVDVKALVLTSGEGARFADALRRLHVNVVVQPAGPDVDPVAAIRLVREIRRFRPDLVHTHLIHADLYGQVAARLTGVPGVSSVHSAHAFYRRQPYRSAAAVAGHLARRTIAISHHVSELLVNAGIVPADRVRMVHYGLDSEAWTSDPEERSEARRRMGLGSEVTIGIASRLIRNKGHESLLEAVAALRGRGTPVRLLVAGDGPLRAELEALSSARGLKGAVEFLGFLSEVRSFMVACDIIAFPTQPELGEGFGLAALEAMALGRPVVATRVASLPELVAHDKSGLLVESGDPAALAGALEQLALDAPLRARLGAGGRERAATMFSLDEMAERTVAVYDEALGDRWRSH